MGFLLDPPVNLLFHTTMVRKARIVIPGFPHHVVHRGNLRAQIFFTVELNPVRAGLVARAEEWEWSSAQAHVSGTVDNLLAVVRPFPGEWRGEWRAFLNQELTSQEIAWIRQNLMTGRPTASREFITALEAETGKTLTPQQRGRKPNSNAHMIDLTEDMFA